jgi:hypothetical protein
LVVVENCAGGKLERERLAAFELQVYPNPSVGFFKVTGHTNGEEVLLYGEIYDGAGRKVYEIKEKVSSNFDLELDLKSYPSGIYRFRYYFNGSEGGQISLIKQ